MFNDHEYRIKYYKEHKNKENKQCRDYYQKHKNERLEYMKIYNLEHQKHRLKYMSIYSPKYYKKNKNNMKKQNVESRRKRLYGINNIQYNELLEKQNNVCAMCQNKERFKHNNKKTRQISVDHDHKTKKIRGLLCHRCNMVLGFANDNIEILKNAIKYLKINKK